MGFFSCLFGKADAPMKVEPSGKLSYKTIEAIREAWDLKHSQQARESDQWYKSNLKVNDEALNSELEGLSRSRRDAFEAMASRSGPAITARVGLPELPESLRGLGVLSEIAKQQGEFAKLFAYVDSAFVLKSSKSNSVEKLDATVDVLCSANAEVPLEYWWLVENDIIQPADILKLAFKAPHGWHSPVTIKLMIDELGFPEAVATLKKMDNIDPAVVPFRDPKHAISCLESFDKIVLRVKTENLRHLFSLPLLKRGLTPEDTQILFGSHFTDEEQVLKTKSKLI
jgi:hypothetical protein